MNSRNDCGHDDSTTNIDIVIIIIIIIIIIICRVIVHLLQFEHRCITTVRQNIKNERLNVTAVIAVLSRPVCDVSVAYGPLSQIK